jgi:hypothetical protein
MQNNHSHGVQSSHQQALELARCVERLLAASAAIPNAHPRMRIAQALAQTLADEIALVASQDAA